MKLTPHQARRAAMLGRNKAGEVSVANGGSLNPSQYALAEVTLNEQLARMSEENSESMPFAAREVAIEAFKEKLMQLTATRTNIPILL